MKKLTIVIFLVLTVFLTSSFKNVEASSYLFIGHIEHTEFVPYNTFFECMGDPNGDPSYLFPSPMDLLSSGGKYDWADHKSYK